MMKDKIWIKKNKDKNIGKEVKEIFGLLHIIIAFHYKNVIFVNITLDELIMAQHHLLASLTDLKKFWR